MNAKKETIQQLEQLIDKHSLGTIVEMLTEICHEKAEHVSLNWQDSITARTWRQDANSLEKTLFKLNN